MSAGLVDLLAPLDVVVLGYHEVPEQTPPDQARLQYEERATDALADVAAEFDGGGTAEYRLVFTHDREQTFERVAAEVGADAYAVPGATGPVDRLLVTLTGDVAVSRIVSFVATLVGDRDIGVTLFLATDDEPGGRELLERTAAPLADRGVDVGTELAVDEPPLEALLDAAVGHDAIVMGERAPSLLSLVFGETAERVAAESVGPVLVVRRVEDEEDEEGEEAEEDGEAEESEERGRDEDGNGPRGSDRPSPDQ